MKNAEVYGDRRKLGLDVKRMVGAAGNPKIMYSSDIMGCSNTMMLD